MILYTLALPYFIFVFSMISRHFSTKTAGHIPLFMIIFLAAQVIIIGWTTATIVFYWNRRAGSGKFTSGQDQIAIQYNTTALLWSICPMVILACMNLLVVWVGVYGLEFG